MNISITLGVPGKQETLQKGFAHGLGSISQTPGKNLPDTVKTIVPHHFEKTENHPPPWCPAKAVCNTNENVYAIEI